MVLTRAQHRKLAAEEHNWTKSIDIKLLPHENLSTNKVTNQVLPQGNSDSELSVGLDALHVSNLVAAIEEVHIVYGAARVGEPNGPHNLLHHVKVKVQDFKNCVGVLQIQDLGLEQANPVYIDNGTFSREYLGLDSNDWNPDDYHCDWNTRVSFEKVSVRYNEIEVVSQTQCALDKWYVDFTTPSTFPFFLYMQI